MKSWLLGTLLALATGCGQPLPPAADTARTIEALRGKWVVINYWARWCKPCLKEIPELNELNSRYDSVTVLGVNYDGVTGDELAEQTQQFGVEFVRLNPAGAVVQTLVGPQTLESLTQATVDSGRGE